MTTTAADGLGPRESVRRQIAEATAAWASGMSLAEIRTSFEALLSRPSRAHVEPVQIGEMPAAWITADGANENVTVLFCHGGGFQIGSLSSHLDIMSRLSAVSGARVLGFEYRLAPEHRFPAAPEDALLAYRWLLARGQSPQALAIAGDSAGGNLALVTALQARDHGLPLPACLVLISPWLDLTMRGESYLTREPLDVFSTPSQLKAMARTYYGKGGDPMNPLISPIEADLAGLPPMLVHTGDHDITLDDSKLLVQRATAQGTEIEFRVWNEMYHHFQVFDDLPEARESLALIGRFIKSRMSGQRP